MSEVVNRVAAALTAEFEPYRVFDEGEADRLARAAIIAMREPTDKMICAALDDFDNRARVRPGQGYFDAWKAMIDAILKDGQ